MPIEVKRALRSSANWTANQTAMEALYGVGNYYTSIAAWEAANGGATSGALTTNNENVVLECYNDWPSGAAGSVTINGWTTDGTRNIVIRNATGEGGDGTPKSGVWFLSATNNYCFIINEPDVEINGLGIATKSTYGIRYGISLNALLTDTTRTTKITNNVIWHESGAVGTSAGIALGYNDRHPIEIFSNVILSTDFGIRNLMGPIGFTADVKVYNNVMTSGVGVDLDFSVATLIKNNLFYSNATGEITGNTGSVTGDYNGTTSATAPTGWTNTTTSVSTTDSVDLVAPSTDDYHLASGSSLISAGTNLYSPTFTTDIDGDTWPSTGAWDIGADHYVAALSALIAGSATASITETDVVNGMKKITITLTGDTWVN